MLLWFSPKLNIFILSWKSSSTEKVSGFHDLKWLIKQEFGSIWLSLSALAKQNVNHKYIAEVCGEIERLSDSPLNPSVIHFLWHILDAVSAWNLSFEI